MQQKTKQTKKHTKM